jgi:hypothetical protein
VIFHYLCDLKSEAGNRMVTVIEMTPQSIPNGRER